MHVRPCFLRAHPLGASSRVYPACWKFSGRLRFENCSHMREFSGRARFKNCSHMSSERHLFPYVMEGSLLPPLILALILLSNLLRGYGAVEGSDTLSLGASLRGNQTLVSQNGLFEFGFFNPNGTNNWYLGIWYAKVSQKAYVWVANRENPVKNMPGILKLSRHDGLGLFDAEGASLWFPNGTKAASEAVLLDSGNFVMLGAENESETVWESFDHPVDTWLPGMKFRRETKLISWRNSADPAPGIFSYGLEGDPSGALQFVFRWNNSVQYSGSGVWDGKIFANIPELASSRYYFKLENDTSGVYFTYGVRAGRKAIPRLVMDKDGALKLYSLFKNNPLSMFWSLPKDQCEVYGVCGNFGTCNSNNIQFCSCLRGFEPRDERASTTQEWWSGACVRRSPLNCGAKNSGEDKLIGLNVLLPDNNNYLDRSYAATWSDCEKACLDNCSCTAVKYTSNICQIWKGDLLSMRSAPPNNDSAVFIRLAASEFPSLPSSKGRRNMIAPVVAVIVACAIVLAILACLLWRRCWTKSNYGWADAFAACLALRFAVASRCTRPEANEVDATTSIRMFTYKELQLSTRSFTHKLGSGAFGSVFRGTLPDGTLVAVKKLQGIGQGEKQFRAEINTVGNINHVNLIRLRGFCAEKSRRLLVYDYMPNGSLNKFLFGNKSKNERKVEDWKTRFGIALGVARGLTYLHEECEERIIHCDVKPENILLDGNFCPKLADFGLAKLVGRDFSRVLTTTRGTRGYLAPEWIAGVPITPKADVFSFGMTLLEIISGRRNLDLDLCVEESSKFYFPTWAANQLHKEDIMSVVDSRVADSADEEQVRRAGVVSLLCIQEDETARPSMGQVLLMLEGKTELHTSQIPSSLFTLPGQQGGTEDSDSNF